MKNKFVNTLYAFVYQFMFVPLLGFFTYYIYDRVIFLDVVISNVPVQVILISGLVIFNILCVYGIAYLYKKFYSFELVYYAVVGLIVSFIGLWLKVYYIAVENINCKTVSNTKCLTATSDNKTFTAVLVFIVGYYLLYLAMFKMVQKKLDIDEASKKKKVSKKKKQ